MSSIHERDRHWETYALMTVMQAAWRFSSWTLRGSGSATFFKKALPQSTPNFEIVGYHNNNGAGAATAESNWSHPELGFTTTGTKEDHHTVSMRMTVGNGESGMEHAIGPATAIHSGGAGVPGNCYGAVMRNVAGVGKVRIVRISTGGVVNFLAEFDAPILAQDFLGIAYRYDTGTGAAELSVLVNGVVVGSFSAAAGFRMSTLAARPGVVGLGAPVIPSASNFGHYFEEWWVVGRYQDAGQVRKTFPRMVGAVKVHLMENKRFQQDAKPKAKWILSRGIESLKFGYQRNGGNASATISLVPQDWDFGVVADPMEKTLQEPYPTEWDERDWHGGDVRILVKYHAQELLVGGSTAGSPNEELWRGRIRTIKYDRLSRAVVISCEGYAAALKERRITDQRKNVSIRTALEDIVLKGAGRKSAWRDDGPIDVVNIVAIQSALDQKVDLDFRMVTVRSAIDMLLSLLPDSMAWGVRPIATADGQGKVEFYVQQAVDPYNVDLSGGLSHPTYDADRALRFGKRSDFGKIRNFITVFGAEIEQGEGESSGPVKRVQGSALARRSAQIWRTKEEVRTESGIPDEGLASKLAAVTVKRKASPKFLVTLSVLEQIDGTHSFFHLLNPFQPWLALRERADPENLLTIRLNGAPAAGLHWIHDRMIRRYGDMAGVALKASGISGTFAFLASTGEERKLNKSWLVHQALKFDTAHDSSLGTHDAFIFGRAATGPGAALGWGALWWQGSTGKLRWMYQEASGAPVVMDTGITVDPTTPAGQVVNFTVWRDAIGDYRFYDGAILKATVTGNRNNVHKNQSTDWRWFDSSQTGGLLHAWDGILDQFWLLDTIALQAKKPGQVAGSGGFIVRTTGKNLPIDESLGLLRHVKFNEAHYSGASGADPNTLPLPGSAAWTRNGPSGVPFAAFYSLSNAVGTSDASPITAAAQVVRGYRMGDESTGFQDSPNYKKWGGPILMGVEKATYGIRPGDGTVETEFELGDFLDRFSPSLALLERNIEKINDILRNTGEDL